MPTQFTQRFNHATQSTDRRIAITRTLAPAAWTALVLWVSVQFGVDLVAEAADVLGLSAATVAAIGPMLMYAVFYLVGKLNPGMLERILLLVPVGDVAYTPPEDGSAQVAFFDLIDQVDRRWFGDHEGTVEAGK